MWDWLSSRRQAITTIGGEVEKGIPYIMLVGMQIGLTSTEYSMEAA